MSCYKGRIPTPIQYKLEDKKEDYSSILNEDLCGILSTTEVKDNRERDVAQIKRISTSKAAPVNYYGNGTIRVICKNKDRTSVLPDCKHHG